MIGGLLGDFGHWLQALIQAWQIGIIYFLLVGAFVSFVWEKIPADVTALALMAVLIVTGLLPARDALSVFSNPAPLTVGAMFILSAALEKCGAIDAMARNLDVVARLPYALCLLVIALVAGGISAFINNTPVVVVFTPVVLALARKMGIPASKFLIPLSYAAVLGGMCTLIGTSTNIVVSSVGQQFGEPPFAFFELAAVGVPMLVVGAVYLMLVGQRLLPVRETLTAILSEEERREFITEAFVQHGSPQVGRTVREAGLVSRRGVRVLEVLRGGVALREDLASLTLHEGDRLLLACRPSGVAHTKQLEGIDFAAEAGLEQIAAHEGLLVEGAIGPNSSLIGNTIQQANFRQRYRVVILAVHRRGHNLRDKLSSLTFEFGDTLLMLGTQDAINNLRTGDDILLIDRPAIATENRHRRMPLVIAAIIGVIGSAALGIAPIEIAAFVAVVALFLVGAVRPKEGYAAIQWNILFMIFAMLGMGVAMERTHAAEWLSNNVLRLVDFGVSPENRPMVMLVCVYLVTMVLTEVLSNNAAGVIMATLAIALSQTMGVSPRPFVVAVAISASAAFATPIGYQTNTYVYGVGGYRFSDFVKIGVPLNIVCAITALLIIPRIWPF